VKFRLPSRSLFWTFAGGFLAVLLLVAVLQGVVLRSVVGPLLARWSEDRGALTVRRTAEVIGNAYPLASGEELTELLQAQDPGEPRFRLVLLDNRGDLFGSRPLPRRLRRALRDVLEGGPAGRFPPPPGEEEGPPREGRGPGAPRFPVHPPRILARASVELAPGWNGELVAIGVPPRFPLWPGAAPLSLLFLPLALVAAAGGGLFAFRLVVRRLRRLEALAGRVAEGDFTARVQEGPDEIGRLGQRLNQMAESLGAARARDLENDRTRRQLLADISHELATPLTTIRGYTETLLDPDVPVNEGERSDYLHAVQEEARRMDLLLQDLFELTRLEAGAIGLHPEPLDLADLVRNMVERFRPRFREAGLSLSYEGPLESAPLTADGRRLEQVFLNLLQNALRYVPQGGHVWAHLRRVERDRGAVRLEVSDDGPGLPPGDLEHVFDRFYRADPSRPSGGSGLGLAILREIVLRHGGAVRAANRPEGGAVFTVDLPTEPPSSAS